MPLYKNRSRKQTKRKDLKGEKKWKFQRLLSLMQTKMS